MVVFSSDIQPDHAAKRYLIALSLFLAASSASLWFLGQQYNYLTSFEVYTVPAFAVGSATLALLFFILPANADAQLGNLLKILYGALMLGGLLEGALMPHSNIEFYLLTLAPFYLFLMFSDLKRRRLKWEYVFFGLSTLVTFVALIYGPLTTADRQFILMVSAVSGQFIILQIFRFLKKVVADEASNDERARTFEEVLKLSEQAKEEAVEANQTKTRFLANMSHEFRTPLNAIIGFSDMLLLARDDPKLAQNVAEYSRLINTAGNDMLALVDGLLDVAKVEAGKMEVWETDVCLCELVGEIFATLEPMRMSNMLTLDDTAVTPQHCLRADRRMLKQIIQNLMSNAIKYNVKNGKVTASGSFTDDGDLVLTIADTGIGMAPHALKHILEPFMRAENSYTRSVEGTGLGLYLVDTMMTLHGGAVSIHSLPDEGTTVRLVFPKERVLNTPVAKPVCAPAQ